MAKDDRHRLDDVKSVKSRRVVEYESPPPAPETEPLRATVNAIFHNDAIISETVKENLKARTLASDAIAERARKAFAEFSPSSYPQDERDERTYLSPGDELNKALDFVVKEGAKDLRHAEASRGIRLARTPELDKLIKKKKGARSSTIGTIDLDDLVDYVTTRLDAGASAPPSDPSLAVCTADEEAERRLKQIETPLGEESGSNATTSETEGSANGDHQVRNSNLAQVLDPPTL